MADALTGGQYEIVVGQAPTEDWSDWFEGFTLETEGQTSRLTGSVADQAGLHGVLARLRDLGIPILEIQLLPGEGERAHETAVAQLRGGEDDTGS